LGDFIFHNGPLPADIRIVFDESLFNTLVYRQLQSPSDWHSFFVIDAKEKKAVAGIHFYADGDVAQSPLRAPFGSIDSVDDLPPQVLFEFILFVDGELKKTGARRVVMKHSPAAYAVRREALLQTFLLNLGYRVASAETGATLPVNGKFEDHLDAWEKRKLKQARTSALQCRQLTPGHLDTLYHFILTSRTQKGYSLSMTLEALQRVVEKFPERYLLFGVYLDDVLVAAGISIVVTKGVLYNFYSAHDNGYDHLSPVVFLIESLYSYCVRHSLTLLDLGTSAVEGKPNFGLLDFKMRLGGIPTPKLTFEKTFS
jgi:hypothetical protein